MMLREIYKMLNGNKCTGGKKKGKQSNTGYWRNGEFAALDRVVGEGCTEEVAFDSAWRESVCGTCTLRTGAPEGIVAPSSPLPGKQLTLVA